MMEAEFEPAASEDPGSLGGDEPIVHFPLPESNPDASRMRERPALEKLGSEEAAPFLRGNVAMLLSDLARELTRQSMAALSEGRNTVVPSVALPASSALLAKMATYMELRGAWLTKYAEAIGIEPPCPAPGGPSTADDRDYLEAVSALVGNRLGLALAAVD